MVTVFVPADAWQQSLAESILDEAGIVYSLQNAQTQDLLGAGQIGGYNFVVGPVQIQVASEDAERARRLIEEAVSGDAREALTTEVEEDELEDKAADSRRALAARYANVSIIWSILWMAGLGSLLAVYYGIRSLRLMGHSPHPSRAKAIFALVLGIVGLAIWFAAWGPTIFGL